MNTLHLMGAIITLLSTIPIAYGITHFIFSKVDNGDIICAHKHPKRHIKFHSIRFAPECINENTVPFILIPSVICGATIQANPNKIVLYTMMASAAALTSIVVAFIRHKNKALPDLENILKEQSEYDNWEKETIQLGQNINNYNLLKSTAPETITALHDTINLLKNQNQTTMPAVEKCSQKTALLQQINNIVNTQISLLRKGKTLEKNQTTILDDLIKEFDAEISKEITKLNIGENIRGLAIEMRSLKNTGNNDTHTIKETTKTLVH